MLFEDGRSFEGERVAWRRCASFAVGDGGGELQPRRQPVPLVVRGDRLAHRLARCRLELRIDRRRDREPAQARLLGLEVIEHPFRELDRFGGKLARDLGEGREGHRLVLGDRPLGVGQEALHVHLVEDIRPAPERSRQAGARVEVARVRDPPRDERRLRDRELAGALAEVVTRGLLYPVAAMAEVDVVEVRLEDLVLRELLLEASREERLTNLACERSFTGPEEQHLDHLLRDGRAALPGAVRAEVDEHCPRDSPVVEALVLVEPGVLRGQDREFDVGRQ